MKKIFIIGMILSTFTACLKEELPIPPRVHVPGETKESQVEMSKDYRYQLFFNLEESRTVSSNLKKIWDIGFECGENGWHILLNSSKSMFATPTPYTSLDQVTDTTGSYKWKLDAITGNLDSTAIGDWMDTPRVYLIDRGYDEKGRHQGLSKVIFKNVSSTEYQISYAEINETSAFTESIIAKRDDISFTAFSFDNGMVEFEPSKQSWDLLFSQYTYVFEEEGNLPYIVVGVLLNRYNTKAIQDTIHTFLEINIDVASSIEFTDAINIPGYNWKSFDFGSSYYIIDTDKNYIIQTQNGDYYKLRFLDFYNDLGETGYPSFEYQKL